MTTKLQHLISRVKYHKDQYYDQHYSLYTNDTPESNNFMVMFADDFTQMITTDKAR